MLHFTVASFLCLKRHKLIQFICTVPAAGPTITNITDINSTSLIVLWRKLSIDDSNGPIFGYRVCYRVLERNAGGICSKIKDVSGVNITWVILTGLMNATTYDIAIRAESSVGFGPVGKIVSHKTLDEGMYCVLDIVGNQCVCCVCLSSRV